jgi:hypothetical protein
VGLSDRTDHVDRPGRFGYYRSCLARADHFRHWNFDRADWRACLLFLAKGQRLILCAAVERMNPV